eukprot:655336-Prorocentrum_lima.AAC.1
MAAHTPSSCSENAFACSSWGQKEDRIYCSARLLSVMDADSDAFKIGSGLKQDEHEDAEGALK